MSTKEELGFDPAALPDGLFWAWWQAERWRELVRRGCGDAPAKAWTTMEVDARQKLAATIGRAAAAEGRLSVQFDASGRVSHFAVDVLPDLVNFDKLNPRNVQ